MSKDVEIPREELKKILKSALNRNKDSKSNRKNGVIFVTESERAAVAAYRDTLKAKVKELREELKRRKRETSWVWERTVCENKIEACEWFLSLLDQ